MAGKLLAKALFLHIVVVAAVGAAAAPAPAPAAAASSAAAAAQTVDLQSALKAATAFREAYTKDPAAACSQKDGLCASAAGGGKAQPPRAAAAALALAVGGPFNFSSADPDSTGGLNLAPAARDQGGCGGGAGFAVAAAAQIAVASALRADASAVAPLSVYDLLYCGAPAPAASCESKPDLRAALAALASRRLAPESCMPDGGAPGGGGGARLAAPPAGGAAQCSQELCFGPDPTKMSFKKDSSDALPQHQHKPGALGSFSYRALPDELSVVEFVRDGGGGVVSGFDLYSDFRDFFKDPKNAQAVYRPSPTAKLLEPHAVAIVGYNLREGYWLALNSWGPKFGDKGLFKVAFGAAGIAKAPGVYGVSWLPVQPPQGGGGGGGAPSYVKPGECFEYRARPGDTLPALSRHFRAPLERLVRDNAAAIRDLDKPLAGVRLSVCGAETALKARLSELQEALDARSLGVALSGGGYQGYYFIGVLSVLRDKRLVDVRTKISATAHAAHCVLCSGRSVEDYVKSVDSLRRRCAKILSCAGTADREMREMYRAFPPAPGTSGRCKDTCYTGLSLHDPRDPSIPASYFDFADYASDAEFAQAQVATAFWPVASSSRPLMKDPQLSSALRGQSVSTGRMTAARVPPPPGVRAALQVAAGAAPFVFPATDVRFVLSAYNRMMTSIGLDELFGAGNGTKAAAAALAHDPTPAALAAAAEQALRLGVDIAPNLFTPLPLVDQSALTDVQLITPTDELATFMLQLGKKDAAAWAAAAKLQPPRA